MPTVGGSLDKLQEQLASIVGKMQNIPSTRSADTSTEPGRMNKH